MGPSRIVPETENEHSHVLAIGKTVISSELKTVLRPRVAAPDKIQEKDPPSPTTSLVKGRSLPECPLDEHPFAQKDKMIFFDDLNHSACFSLERRSLSSLIMLQFE